MKEKMDLLPYIGVVLLLTQISFVSCFVRDFRTFNKNVSQTLDSLLANNRYDKRIRPDIGGPPTVVSVNMYIKSIGPISEIEQLYAMDVYFRQSWYDRRLSFDLPGVNEFSMSWLFLDKVWKPDTYFTNGKKSYLHRITSPNKFLRVRNDGFLMYSMRLTFSATCRMYLKKFPMDTQRCPLVIGSYGYTSSDVLYNWKEGGIGLEPGMELAQYELVNVSKKDNVLEMRGPIIKATFVLKRNIGYFVLQMYVPCILMVCSSWVNFWIDPDATPARVQLSVTSVLSITTIGFVGRSALPKVPYPTALDWFVILCFVFVFAVLVEYAVINFIDKVTEDIKKILQDREKRKKEQEEEKERERALLQASEESIGQDTPPNEPSLIKKHSVDIHNICPYTCGSTSSQGPILKVPIPTITIQSETVSTNNPVQPTTQQIIEQGSINFDLEMMDIEMIDKSYIDPDDSISRRTISSRLSQSRRKLCIPFQVLKEVRILPTEKEISEKKGEKKKFTKIDTRSRIVFPVLFTSVMCLYVLLYTYVVVDNIDYVED
ncbi:gamma-aminobutyric acid receptor subunit alpha-6-like isoform X2 [Lycorma delicatula]|uniref:gamma-aminobutyric acid receptor subunit alpha-6-like isoform X2 n=1 Tax=Lycorma delicatula TaxID=130591 RepID=UPI003F51667D